MIEYRNLKVALLGGGSVGAQVATLLLEHGDELASRAGAGLELIGVAVRNPDAKRDPEIPAELITTDAETLIHGADIVIELMGGLEPARTYILQALNSGADVITANKALLATHGPELFEAAEQVGAQLYYEAAVAGAILLDDNDAIVRLLGGAYARQTNHDHFVYFLTVKRCLGYPSSTGPTAAAEILPAGKHFGAQLFPTNLLWAIFGRNTRQGCTSGGSACN